MRPGALGQHTSAARIGNLEGAFRLSCVYQDIDVHPVEADEGRQIRKLVIGLEQIGARALDCAKGGLELANRCGPILPGARHIGETRMGEPLKTWIVAAGTRRVVEESGRIASSPRPSAIWASLSVL